MRNSVRISDQFLLREKEKLEAVAVVPQLDSRAKQTVLEDVCSSVDNSTEICVCGAKCGSCQSEIAWHYLKRNLKGIPVNSAAWRVDVTVKIGLPGPKIWGNDHKLSVRGKTPSSFTLCSRGFLFPHHQCIFLCSASALTCSTAVRWEKKCTRGKWWCLLRFAWLYLGFDSSQIFPIWNSLIIAYVNF